VVSSNEELKVAEAALAAINTLFTSVPNPDILATLRKAKDVATRATTTVRSERLLNEARHTVEIALSDLTHGPLGRRKINKAKDAIEVWVNRLLD
jgi:hypothetical protein